MSFWRKHKNAIDLIIFSAGLVLSVMLAISEFQRNGFILQKINVILLIVVAVFNIVKISLSICRQRKQDEQQSQETESSE